MFVKGLSKFERNFIKQFPDDLLSEEEEKALARKKNEGDSVARDKLIRHNLRLVFCIAKNYVNYTSLEFFDLFEEGVLGLIKAVDLFDPEKGRLSSYAFPSIKQAIARGISSKENLIAIPGYLQIRIRKMDKIQIEHYKETGQWLPYKEIAEMQNLNYDIACNAKIVSNESLLYLFDPVQTDEANSEKELFEFIKDSSLEDFIKDVENEYVIEKLLEMAGLTPKETEVLFLRFGIQSWEHTLQEIGEKFGITREGARQIVETSLKKIRKVISPNYSDYID